ACRRRPMVTLLLALLMASLFGGLGGVTWKWLEADAEKQTALYQTYRARIAAAVGALALHDVADARRQLKAAPEELRDWEWRHLHSRLDDSSEVIPLPGEGVGWLLAAPDQLRIGAMTPAGLRLMDLKGGEHRTLPLGAGRGPAAFPTQTRHGLRVVAWVGNKAFDLLDEAGQVLCRVELPENREPWPVVVSPDGTRLACLRRDGEW